MLRALLPTLATVLLFASSAAAECAWVLWSHLATPAPGVDSWGVFETYPTREECVAAMVDEAARKSKDGITWRQMPGQQHTLVGLKGKVLFHLRCLPDTVNPRGAKGK